MSLSIVCDELLWEPCTWCNRNGANLPDGFCDVCSNQGEVPIDVSDLATLAHNLAIGAALCRAFELGRRREACPVPWGGWVSGCGKAAP